MGKILHIGGNDKFTAPFIELVKENFDFGQHQFHFMKGMGKELNEPNVKYYPATIVQRLKYYFFATIKMQRADKIILHGLFDWRLVLVLFCMPWLLKKCYWLIWGGDLYVYELGKRDWRWKRNEFFRRRVIKNMGNIVVYVTGEYELAKRWYNTKANHIRCFMYPSNLYKSYAIGDKVDNGLITVLVGNSADPTNNHLEIFDKLKNFNNRTFRIISPLSYGNEKYKIDIIKIGKKYFGDNFRPLTDFLTFNEYLMLLSDVDIAIFAHKRQQAMGNIRTLLSLGKKVYMRQDITSADCFKEDGIKTYNYENLELSLDYPEKCQNIEKMKEIYSKENLVYQWGKIFNG